MLCSIGALKESSMIYVMLSRVAQMSMYASVAPRWRGSRAPLLHNPVAQPSVGRGLVVAEGLEVHFFLIERLGDLGQLRLRHLQRLPRLLHSDNRPGGLLLRLAQSVGRLPRRPHRSGELRP